MKWTEFRESLPSRPDCRHRFMPPATIEQVREFERLHGATLPECWKEFLLMANGASLFNTGISLITLFGVMSSPPLPPLEWPEHCCLNYWIKKAHQSGLAGLPVARTSYDTLWIITNERFDEWDLQEDIWQPKGLTVSDWMQVVIFEGKQVLVELGSTSQPPS